MNFVSRFAAAASSALATLFALQALAGDVHAAAPSVASSPASVAPAYGSTITLAAEVLADTPVTYVWTRDDIPLIDGGRYSGATTGTLVITGANNSDDGAYTLTVANAEGTASTTPATVTVAQIASALDPFIPVASATGGYTNVVLHLPDGRTLLGGRGTFNGAAGTSASSGLIVIEADGRVTEPACGAFNGEITSLYRQPDGKILLTGYYSKINDIGGSGRAGFTRLNPDLTVDPDFQPEDSITPRRIFSDAQGRVYLAGDFCYLLELAYSYLVRLQPDGSLDRGYQPKSGNGIGVVAFGQDGVVYIAGSPSLSEFPPTPANAVLRLLPDGTIDPTFDPTLTKSGQIGALAVQPDGKVLVATGSDGAALVRLLPDGSIDTSFNYDATTPGSVSALSVLPSGQIMVAGTFTTPTNRLLRINADGTRDTTFDVGTGLTSSTGGPVTIHSIVPDPSGRIWISGAHSMTYDGVPANGLAILQGDAPALAFATRPVALVRELAGAATFTATALGNNGFAYQWFKNGEPLADDDRISGATTASLTITGLVAADSAAYEVVVTTSPGVSLASVAAPLAVLAAPEVVVDPASVTVDFGGSATFSGFVRGAATLSYQWLFEGAPVADGTTGGLAISGATTPTLTVTGATFARAGAYRLRVTNTLGTATTAPAVLTVQRHPGSLAVGFGSPTPNGTVHAILRLADGSMLIGGQFTSILVNGVANPRQRLARFLLDGTLDPAFTPNFDNHVRALAQDSAGRIFVGGDFTTITFGATVTSRLRVARLTSALALDTAFNPPATSPGSMVHALAPTGDGGVYIGGFLIPEIGAAPGLNHLARLGASGALDTRFNASATILGEVQTLLRRPDGALYVGSYGNLLLSPTGVRDTAFVAESPSSLAAVNAERFLLLDDGSLVVAGKDALSSSYLRRLNANTGATLTNYAALLAAAKPSLAHWGSVTALARQDDGKLLSISDGTLRRTNLAGVATTPDDTSFAPFRANGSIRALATDSLGRIWVGGSLTTYNGLDRRNLAILAGGNEDTRSSQRTPQKITFTDIPDRVLSANPAANTVALSATASSGLAPITFSITSRTPAGIATISGSTLTITGAGSITVTATQAGNPSYASVTASQTFTVNKDTQSITFDKPAARTFGSAPAPVVVSSTSGLPVTLIVTAGPATINGEGKLVLTGAGSVTLLATQFGNEVFKPAAAKEQTLLVNKAAQKITFSASLPAKPLPLSPSTLSLSDTSASSGLPVAIAVVSGPATLEGSTLRFTGTGAVRLRATQAGDANYLAAPAVDKIITVTSTAKLTIDKPSLSAAYDGLDHAVTVTGAPAGFADKLAVTYNGSLTLPRNAGTYAVVASLGTLRATASLVIRKADLAVSFDDHVRLVATANPTFFEPKYTGFVNGETAANLAATTRPRGITKATLSSNQGAYPITFTGGSDKNYRYVAGAPAYLTVVGYGGTYEALLVDDASTPVGKLTLAPSKNSLAYTGTINLARETSAVVVASTSKSAGTTALVATEDFSSASATWTRNTAGKDTLALDFTVNRAGQLTGSLKRNGEAFATLSGGRILYAPPAKTNIDWAGQHTLALHSAFDPADSSLAFPRGSGVATAAVSATNGNLALSGKLADGTTLTATLKPWITRHEDGSLDQVGYVAWITPYGTRTESFLAGALDLQPQPETGRFRDGRRYIPSDEGLLVWKKAGNTKDASYRSGFGPLSVSVSLDPWLPPLAAKPAKGAVPAVVAVTLPQRLGLVNNNTATAGIAISHGPDELDLGERESALPFSATLAATATPTATNALALNFAAPATNLTNWKLTSLNPATGAFAGTFVLRDPAPTPAKPAATKDRTVAFTGTLRQAPDDEEGVLVGTGFFLVPALPGAASTEQPSGELGFSVPPPAP